MSNYDSHVRAREALIARVIRRWHEWSPMAYAGKSWRKLSHEEQGRRIHSWVAQALSAHKWRNGWGDKHSRYEAFGRPQVVVGIYADVPAHELHQIMCDAIPDPSERAKAGAS